MVYCDDKYISMTRDLLPSLHKRHSLETQRKFFVSWVLKSRLYRSLRWFFYLFEGLFLGGSLHHKWSKTFVIFAWEIETNVISNISPLVTICPISHAKRISHTKQMRFSFGRHIFILSVSRDIQLLFMAQLLNAIAGQLGSAFTSARKFNVSYYWLGGNPGKS